mmetsp:Transcript_14835/g.20930  ORF Transcript_14835/g.20930 Transcript_14835/m.20930 type:complete len:141 (-) Transcript_14835:320-742(-)|eukprot:CAMPEP_0175101108 /NCGR_PEP_ID=MMETSP0086_2-20121207/7568_1 /TAXON_ID=136419 /ORGANISM="Unknown Unknown, Strain D1" /LENGTH=140 /DNA_ID=CAMNT_0016375511 /DNA_START=30 /DNA_END=452 /DNA_ORIENTATION=+
MDAETANKFNEKMNEEFKKLKQIAENLSKLGGPRDQYTSQLNENEMVAKELEALDDEANLFKMIGPVMVKQDVEEAKTTVQGRITYFKEELERLSKAQKDLEQQQEEQAKKCQELRDVARKTQQAMVQAQLAAQQQGGTE